MSTYGLLMVSLVIDEIQEARARLDDTEAFLRRFGALQGALQASDHEQLNELSRALTGAAALLHAHVRGLLQALEEFAIEEVNDGPAK